MVRFALSLFLALVLSLPASAQEAQALIDAEAPELSVARFWLCEAARITVSAALGILGVTPRERM